MWRHNDVIGRNEYLISTWSESTVPYVYSLQFLFKSMHYSWRYERKCEWVFFSEHSAVRETVWKCFWLIKFRQIINNCYSETRLSTETTVSTSTTLETSSIANVSVPTTTTECSIAGNVALFKVLLRQLVWLPRMRRICGPITFDKTSWKYVKLKISCQ